MASEMPGCKNIMYIPPSSPPPIDILPDDNDYDVPDTDEAYDITGLSQKLTFEGVETTEAYSTDGDLNVEEKNDLESVLVPNVMCETPDSLSLNENIEIEDCKYIDKISFLECSEKIEEIENNQVNHLNKVVDSTESIDAESTIEDNRQSHPNTPPTARATADFFSVSQISETAANKTTNTEVKFDSSEVESSKSGTCDLNSSSESLPLRDIVCKSEENIHDFSGAELCDQSAVVEPSGVCELSDEEFEVGEKMTPEDQLTDDFGDFYSSNDVVTFSRLDNCDENYTDEFQYIDPTSSYTEVKADAEVNFVDATKIIKNSEESLQLEFSDDDDQDNYASHERLSKDEDSFADIVFEDEKFHYLIIKWIPTLSHAGGSLNFTSSSKLNELVEETFIWYHVANVESCLALQFSWSNSRTNKLYLSSLNVDTRNILVGHRPKWMSTIPLFAQALSFSPLTPIRPPNDSSVSWNLENNPVTRYSYIPQQMEHFKKIKPVSETQQASVPPAEFDWKSSGLTDPLNFKVKKDQDISVESVKTPFSSPSEVEMERSQIQKVPEEDSKDHSLRVKEVLRSIPDLNFMRSKVLMFPI